MHLSDVPGLAKQTSTPPESSVSQRASAPFISSHPLLEEYAAHVISNIDALATLQGQSSNPVRLIAKGTGPASLRRPRQSPATPCPRQPRIPRNASDPGPLGARRDDRRHLGALVSSSRRRPSSMPSALARLRPAMTRSRIIERSNSRRKCSDAE